MTTTVSQILRTTPDQLRASRAWLEQLLALRRGPIANWFHYAVRGGAQTPGQALAAVCQTCARRRAGSDHPDAALTLQALDSDQAGALAYAQWVIDYEALPQAARQRRKAERTFAALKDAMQGKAATEAQLRYLADLGYRGTPPANRAHASTLIDRLLQQQGGHA